MRLLYDTSGVGSHTYTFRPGVGDGISDTDITLTGDWIRTKQHAERVVDGLVHNAQRLRRSRPGSFIEGAGHVAHGGFNWLREGYRTSKTYGALSTFLEFKKETFAQKLWDLSSFGWFITNCIQCIIDFHYAIFQEGGILDVYFKQPLERRKLYRLEDATKTDPIALNIDLDAFSKVEQGKIAQFLYNKDNVKNMPVYLRKMMDSALRLNSVVILTSNAPEARKICEANIRARRTGKLCINANNGQYIAVPNTDGTMHVLRDERINDEVAQGMLDIFKPELVNPGPPPVLGPSPFFADSLLGLNTLIDAHVKGKDGNVKTVKVKYGWSMQVIDQDGKLHNLPILPPNYNSLNAGQQQQLLAKMYSAYSTISWHDCQSIKFMPYVTHSAVDINVLDPQEKADIYESITNKGMAELTMTIDDFLSSGRLSPAFERAFDQMGLQPNGLGGFTMVPNGCSSIRGAIRIAAELGIPLTSIPTPGSGPVPLSIRRDAAGNPILNANNEPIIEDAAGNEYDYNDIDIDRFQNFLCNPESMTVPVSTKKLRRNIRAWKLANPGLSQMFWLQQAQLNQIMNEHNMLHQTLKDRGPTLKTSKAKLKLIGRNAIAERKAGFSFFKWIFEPRGVKSSSKVLQNIGRVLHIGGKSKNGNIQENMNKSIVNTYNK